MERDIKFIDLQEFIDLGFLQEANRLFFHPHGLALSVSIDKGTGKVLGFAGVWDYREDPEGIVFGDRPNSNKALSVFEEAQRHLSARISLMGYDVQPLSWPEDV